MKKIILLAIVLTACNTPVQRSRFVCTCEQLVKVEEFISKNVEGANNKSDEEMEDVIRELKRTAFQIHCKASPIWVQQESGETIYELNKLDSCETIIPWYAY